MKISLAADHAGYEYKKELIQWLESRGYKIDDFGCYSSESCDYPDYALPAARAVSLGECNYGIIICGTGIGMAITANKVRGVRAANCCTPEMAKLARSHNNANVLTFGARLIGLELAKDIIRAFLETEFEGGRHLRRVDKIE
jgi:ribose 5-phosphate isomerase B